MLLIGVSLTVISVSEMISLINHREEDPYEIKIQKVFQRSKGNNGQVKENVKSVSSGGSHSKEISDRLGDKN